MNVAYKRGGGEREINAPRGPLLKLQQQLRPMLDELYRPRGGVNGFVKSRSVLTNARPHLKSRWILNIDLKDFFHSIHFGRIQGRLEANPYNLTKAVAHAVANAACFSGRLPQGGAMSPVLSNMVADRLDSELTRLCRTYRCRYTRYADDITISTNAKRFPRSLAYFDDSDDKRSLVIGHALGAVIQANDFELNARKSRLNSKSDRQEITGIVVNEKMNVRRTFVRQIRAMLHAWEKFGLDAAQVEHLKRWRSPIGRVPLHESNNFEHILRGKLEFLRSVQGENKTVCRKLLVRFNGLPDRHTPPFRLLPTSAIELLNESTYCLEVTNLVDTHSSALPSEMHTGTAFFLHDVGLVTCAHCVGEQMEIYHPDRRDVKYRVRCRVKDDLADVAILDLVDPLLVQPRGMLRASDEPVRLGDEVRAAGFPEKFPEGALSIARAYVD
jgi:RNA-directed DNA polymerase